ncbi:hypothetical protein PHMEG_00021333 [Phytophthora megakarya]|uniref:Uncharacterized protein n=1 Tax=Phytophthora megakarya TaxID=4795 RepID=A0A225VMR9_9STRA|nr:hypothetical protein PHMEG_00021333 [Phytophthora megakarya]
MALDNVFVVYRFNKNMQKKMKPTDFAVLEDEAANAREMTAPSFSRERGTPFGDVYVENDHCIEENTDTVAGDQGVKRRHRSCKVCASYNVKPRKSPSTTALGVQWEQAVGILRVLSADPTFFTCLSYGRKYLCNVERNGRLP